jgi:hypothetical protein
MERNKKEIGVLLPIGPIVALIDSVNHAFIKRTILLTVLLDPWWG